MATRAASSKAGSPSAAGPAEGAPQSKGLRLTLKKLGLTDVMEGLLCLPGSFSDLRYPTRRLPQVGDAERRLYALTYTGECRGFRGSGAAKRAIDMSDRKHWNSVDRFEMDFADDDGNVVTWTVFGKPWAYRHMTAGEVTPLVGRVEFFGHRAFISDAERPPAYAVGRIWVKYLGISGRLVGDKVEELVRSQVDNPEAYRLCASRLVGAIGLREEDALSRVGSGHFLSFGDLLKALHQPVDVEQGWAAKKVANGLAAAAVQASALRHNLRHPHPRSPLPIDMTDVDALARTQPENLSAEQLAAARAIAEGLRDPKPLNALLNGDVGTGKTLAYLLPAVAAHRAGARVAIMAPTNILADQIALQIVQRFGSMVRGVERVAAGGSIADHASIVVSGIGFPTVAARESYIPSLVVFDEQHKMSTAVREKLVKPWTHVVEVSATPVPRSLASALFGGKRVFNIRECPVNKTINCLVGDTKERRKFGGMLKWALDNGQRAAVIYPVVGEANDEEAVSSVLAGARTLEQAFPGKVVALHGRMAEGDISSAIEQVRSGEKPLVVASTVIETGVDIPGITAMVVRDADRFGISQLHQLRGRLVRHGGEGWFGMMVEDLDSLPAETVARLHAIANCNDGYELAERDLVLRGFGELDGQAQSGATETVFRLVRLRPEDFLRSKLSDLAIQTLPPVDEPGDDPARADQPRLFA